MVDAVLHRYAEARHIGEGLAEGGAGRAGSVDGRTRAGGGQPVGPRPGRAGRGGGAGGRTGRPDVQVLSERAGLPGSFTVDGGTVLTMLGLLQGARISDDAYVTDVSLAVGRHRPRHHPGHRHRASGRGPGGGGQAGAVHQAHGQSADRGPADAGPAAGPSDPGPPGRGARLRLVTVPRRRAGPPGTRRRMGADGRRGRSSGPSGDPDQRPGHRGRSTRPTAPSPSTAWPATGGWSTAATTATPTTTRHPSRTRRSTRPTRCRSTVDERGPVRAVATVDATYTWPDRVDDSTKSRVGGHRVRGGDHRGAPGRRAAWCGSAPGSSTRPGTTACGSTSPCPGRRPPRRPSAPSPWSSGDSVAEGRADEVGHPDLPVPPVRLGRGPDRGPRGAARVRAGRPGGRPGTDGRAGPPPWPSPCCGRPGCCPVWA